MARFWCAKCDKIKPVKKFSRSVGLLALSICKKCDALLTTIGKDRS